MTGHPPTLDRHIFNTEGRCTNGCGADAGRALTALANIEWIFMLDADGVACPECYQDRDHGHLSCCGVGDALGVRS